MAQLPILSGKEAVKTFEKFGWQIARPNGKPHYYDKRRRDSFAFRAESSGGC